MCVAPTDSLDRSGGIPYVEWSQRGTARPSQKVAEMGFADKLSYKAQELRGCVTRNTGEVLGDRRMRAEGGTDELVAKFKQAVERVKDAFRGRAARRRPPGA